MVAKMQEKRQVPALDLTVSLGLTGNDFFLDTVLVSLELSEVTASLTPFHAAEGRSAPPLLPC